MPDCDCKIIYEEGLLSQRIDYCPLHKAAPKLAEALKELVICVNTYSAVHPKAFKREMYVINATLSASYVLIEAGIAL